MDSLYAHVHFDDLDLDARSQWVGKGAKISALHALGSYEQAVSLKLATTVGHFDVTLTLTLQPCIRLVHLVFFPID